MKAPRLVLSEAAVSDILEQSDWYEAQSGKELARRWEKAVTSTLLRISRGPRSGSPCKFGSPELLGARRAPIAGFPRHLVFYLLSPDDITILRIVHGARDLESLFSA